MSKDKDGKKHALWKRLERKGCAWSYAKNPEAIDDELLIEKALVYLDFEEMHLLCDIYPRRVLRRVWRERLVPQGSYYNIINWLLAAMLFNIHNPDKYLKRYGRPRLETQTEG